MTNHEMPFLASSSLRFWRSFMTRSYSSFLRCTVSHEGRHQHTGPLTFSFLFELLLLLSNAQLLGSLQHIVARAARA